MQTELKIKYAIILLGIVAAIAIIITLFRSLDKRNDSMFKALIESHERELKSERDHRATLERVTEEKDRQINEHKRIDSLLATRQVQTKIIYEKVAPTVRNYSHDELRSAVWEFSGE